MLSTACGMSRSRAILGDRGDVGELEGGIGGRLGEEQPGVVAQRGAHRIRIGGVDEAELDAEAVQHPGGEPMRAAVDDVRDHRVLARVQERHHHRGGGRHAGAEAGAAGPAFQGADALLQRDHGGISGARVRVSLRHVVFHRLLDVGGRLVDRSQDGSGHRIGRDSGMHFPRLELHGADRLPGTCSEGRGW